MLICAFLLCEVLLDGDGAIFEGEEGDLVGSWLGGECSSEACCGEEAGPGLGAVHGDFVPDVIVLDLVVGDAGGDGDGDDFGGSWSECEGGVGCFGDALHGILELVDSDLEGGFVEGVVDGGDEEDEEDADGDDVFDAGLGFSHRVTSSLGGRCEVGINSFCQVRREVLYTRRQVWSVSMVSREEVVEYYNVREGDYRLVWHLGRCRVGGCGGILWCARRSGELFEVECFFEFGLVESSDYDSVDVDDGDAALSAFVNHFFRCFFVFPNVLHSVLDVVFFEEFFGLVAPDARGGFVEEDFKGHGNFLGGRVFLSFLLKSALLEVS